MFLKRLFALLVLLDAVCLTGQSLTDEEIKYLISQEYNQMGKAIDSLSQKYESVDWLESTRQMEKQFETDSAFTRFIYDLGYFLRTSNPGSLIDIFTLYESRYGTQDSSALAAMLAMKANALQKMGQFEEALREAHRGLSYLDPVEDRLEYYSNYADLCYIYHDLDDFETPVEIIEECLAHTTIDDGDYRYYGKVYLQGLNYYYLENYDSAISQYSRIIDYEPWENQVGWAYSHSEMARVYRKQMKFEKTIYHAKIALGWAQENGDIDLEIGNYDHLGVSYGGLGNIDSASYFFGQADLRLQNNQMKMSLIEHKRAEFQGMELAGQYRRALDAHKRMYELEKDVRTEEVKKAKEEYQTQYETAQKEAENLQLKAQNEQQRLIVIATVIVALLLALFGIYIYRIKERTKALYAQISAQAFELNKANKTKDRLFSIIGHDLRGPISSFETANSLIKNYLEKRDTDKVDLMVNQVDKSVKSLKMLLDNLLNWSLGQQGELELRIESLKLKPIIDEVFEVLSEPARFKNIQLRHALNEERILADKDTITTVFRNLVSNAIKFSPDHSTITVQQKVAGNFLEIEVQDHGVGMNSNQLSKLFEIDKSKVRKGTAREMGSGLGLVLVKEFVEMNQGKVTVESQPGQGSIFHIHLPVAS